MYYNIAAALILVSVAAGLAALYWRKRIIAQRAEDDARLSAEQRKAAVVRKQVTDKAQNSLDVMSSVLVEVQSLQEGIDNLLVLLTMSQLTPGQEEWNLALRMIKEKSKLLGDILTVTLELQFYEKLRVLDQDDQVAVNGFCHNVFDLCMGLVPKGVDLHFETSLDDNYIVQTNKETLTRLVRNLLVNSMSNTSEGSITLAVYENKKKGQLMFAVSDTAPAIPEDLRDQIFKWMPRGNLHQMLMTLRVRSCKIMARLLGGTFYIESDEEKGVSAVFSINIKHDR